MANAYRKMYLQIVFAVKNRQALLHKSWRAELFRYIAGIINQRGHYSLAVNGVEDHVHIFLCYGGHELVHDLVREIKKASNAFIKANNFCPYKFEWQSGYGVFSYSYRERDKIMNYVLKQEEHHRKKSFQKEYLKFLEDFEIEYKDEYLFDFWEREY